MQKRAWFSPTHMPLMRRMPPAGERLRAGCQEIATVNDPLPMADDAIAFPILDASDLAVLTTLGTP